MTVYLCVAPYAWGKDKTTGNAIRRCRKSRPSFCSKNMEYNLYEVPEDAYVDNEGYIHSSEPPKMLRQVRYVGNQRQVKEINATVPEVREPGGGPLAN